ncbi:MAG: TonB-dependent receptor [Pseudomonadota bacterium]
MQKLLLAGVFAPALAPVFFSTAQAQETTDPDDQIVVTGLRPVPIDDVTASVTVIDQALLEIRSSPYIADQLRLAPGVGVSRSGERGGLTQVRIRGAEANHTILLIEGVEASDPVTGETDFGLWSGVDATRIEVARGEQSALYGSDAIGGVISVTTNKDPGLAAAAEGGSQGTARGFARYGLGNETARVAATATAFRTNGVDTSGTGGAKDGSTAYSGMLNGSVDLNQDWSVRGLFRFGYSKNDFDPDADFDGLLDDADRETKNRQWMTGAIVEGDAIGASHILRANYGRVRRENFADQVFTDETIGERVKVGYSPSVSFNTSGADISVAGLVEYEQEDYERISLDTSSGDPNQQQSFETIGIAGETRISFDAFAMNASLRHDDNDGRFDNTTTWRVGATYAFPFGTRIRASYGTGVKNPTFTELFGFFPGSFIGNPDLMPEKSSSYEIGLEQTIGAVDLSAVYFSADLENEIVTLFNPDFTSSPANLAGQSERRGVEVSALWRATSSLTAFASYANIDSEDDADVNEIRVPGDTASFSLDWRSLSTDGLRAGVGIDYVGEQDDFFFTFPAQRVTLDSYVLVSATAEIPIADRISLTLRGENIFDEEVVDVFGSAQPGVGVFAGIRIR